MCLLWLFSPFTIIVMLQHSEGGVNDVAKSLSISNVFGIARDCFGVDDGGCVEPNRTAEHNKRRMAALLRRPEGHEILAARSDQRIQL